MKRLIFPLLISACMPSVAHAGCISSAPALEWSYQGLNVVDKAETSYILHSGKGYETSHLLGRHPSDLKLAAFTVGTGALHLGITCAIGEWKGYHSKAMMAWQVGSNVAQGVIVGLNLKIALGYRK